MRNNENGDAQLAVDILQRCQHGLGGKKVQRAGGLIAQKHLRGLWPGPGNGYTLFLPAGNAAPGRPWPYRQGPQGSKSSCTRAATVCLWYPFSNFQGKGHVLGHRFLHQQVIALKHNAHFAPCAAQRLARQGGKVFPSSSTRPCVGFSSTDKQRSRVDLPAPDMPMMPNTSPFSTRRLTSSSATTRAPPSANTL